MSSFTKSFSTTTPAGSDRASDLDTILQDDKAAIKERLAIEHHDLTASTTKEASNAPGRLRPGLAGVILECSAAERQAIKDTLSTPATIVDGRTAWGPGKGAVVRDSTSGKLYIWDSGLSDWKQLDLDYRTPTGSSAYLTNTYLTGNGYFPISLTTLAGVNGQDQLNTLFGTSASIKFSDTRNTAVHLLAVLKNTAVTSWLFGATIAATASGTRAPMGACVCQLQSGATNATFNTGAQCVIVPAGMYFKFQVFYQASLNGFNWTSERASVFVSEITTAFATFNICAFML